MAKKKKKKKKIQKKRKKTSSPPQKRDWVKKRPLRSLRFSGREDFINEIPKYRFCPDLGHYLYELVEKPKETIVKLFPCFPHMIAGDPEGLMVMFYFAPKDESVVLYGSVITKQSVDQIRKLETLRVLVEAQIRPDKRYRSQNGLEHIIPLFGKVRLATEEEKNSPKANRQVPTSGDELPEVELLK